ncbi:hypothetical protein [Stenotrophomonas maltophilia]|uniref:hypothetical protein n=1 Tax=Stenotrophomonas maltophilia TaxID=40324 RepID=UPI001FA736E8|nr:hypothetical protein [Stenotrophomonas maltophilia]
MTNTATTFDHSRQQEQQQQPKPAPGARKAAMTSEGRCSALAESPAATPDHNGWVFVAGGEILIRGEWSLITWVNKRRGRTTSLRLQDWRKWTMPLAMFHWIEDYRRPSPEAARAAKANRACGPIVNMPTDGCSRMTTAEYKALPRGIAGTQTYPAKDGVGAHRYRLVICGPRKGRVYLTDAKIVSLPRLLGGSADANDDS